MSPRVCQGVGILVGFRLLNYFQCAKRKETRWLSHTDYRGFTPLIQPNFLSDTRCGFWLVYVPNDDIRSYEPFGASSDSFSHNGGTSNIPVFSCSPCARALSARMSRAHHRRGERRAAHGIRSAHGCGRSQPLWASLPPLPRRWRPRQVAANLAAAAVWVLMMRSRLARARRGR